MGYDKRESFMKKVAIFNPFLSTKGGGERSSLSFASVLSQMDGVQVSVLSYGKSDKKELERYFSLDLSKVKIIEVDLSSKFIHFVQRSKLPNGIKCFVTDYKTAKVFRSYSYDVFINHCYMSNLPNIGKKGYYLCMFPQELIKKSPGNPLKFIYWWALGFAYKTFIFKGANIISISNYTQSYVTKFWNRESTLLYSPCDNMNDPKVTEKKNIILSVGRFFEIREGSHNKRQDVLLEGFKKLTDLHEKGWELHFIGSVAKDIGALEYIIELMKSASGFPVVFHFDAPHADVKRLFNEAKIYWHATGYGTKLSNHPEMQEHFGITTVEAMSAGAVPVVIARAGQLDTVENSVSGYHWGTLDELVDLTGKVAKLTPAAYKTLSDASKKRAALFSQSAFCKAVESYFKPKLNG
jgi:glycosyltransferase involved in cell wall biosynthesis